MEAVPHNPNLPPLRDPTEPLGFARCGSSSSLGEPTFAQRIPGASQIRISLRPAANREPSGLHVTVWIHVA